MHLYSELVRKFSTGISSEKTHVVTLCGSTRFEEKFHAIERELGVLGIITLSCCWFHHSTPVKPTHYQKSVLDERHLRMIDISNEVVILNVDGYIGKSTFSEMSYAISHHIPVYFLQAPFQDSNEGVDH